MALLILKRLFLHNYMDSTPKMDIRTFSIHNIFMVLF